MISKAATAKYFYNLDSDTETSKQLATSGKEIVSLLITSGGFAAAARVYDSADGQGNKARSILIAANAGESTPFTPASPIHFKDGIYVEMEQGASGGGELLISWN